VKKVLRVGVLALAGVAAVLLVGAAWAGTAREAKSATQVTLSAKLTPFTAAFAGRAVVRATSDATAVINATGAGKGNVVGASKITGIGAGFQGDPCSTFTGKGTMTGKLGKLNFTLNPGAKACSASSDPNKNAITATAKVTGGTLKFRKARGTLKITGIYDRGTGKFTATFKGAITL
jgi:hypothetical protein